VVGSYKALRTLKPEAGDQSGQYGAEED